MNLLRFITRPFAILLLLCMALPVWAAMYDMPPPGSDVIGQVQHIKTKASDTFVGLASKYDVGFIALKAANPGVDAWLPGDGTPLTIPTAHVLPNAPRKGIIINLAEMRVYYFPPKGSKYAGKVFTFPVGIGRKGWLTPLAHTRIIQKIPHPSWTPPASIKKEHAKRGDPLPDVVPAGPDNPLGQFALRLGLPAYLMHGTNKPAGIGMRVSHGCVRLFPKDIAKLFSMVSVGTPVNIVSQPYKVGWNGDKLVLEAHEPKAAEGSPDRSYKSWVHALIEATKKHPDTPIDWQQAESAVRTTTGLPVQIGVMPGQKPVSGGSRATSKPAQGTAHGHPATLTADTDGQHLF